MADLRSYFQGHDLDSGAGTDYVLGVNLRLTASGGSIEAAGQKVMASSIPVVLASDQSSVAVDSELPAAAALADAAANPTTPTVGAAALLFNGTNWDRMRGDTTNGLDVDVTRVTGTVTVDSELPAAAALADNATNPTSPLVGACLLGFDGTTWDRIYTLADGDTYAAATKGLLMLGQNGTTNYQALSVDTTGALNVVVGAATTPVNNYQTSAALAAGSTASLSTPEAASKRLARLEVFATVAYKCALHTVDNSVESTDPVVVGGGQAFMPFQWNTTALDYVKLGATVGTDAFRVKVTNLDDANAADVYATFHYQD